MMTAAATETIYDTAYFTTVHCLVYYIQIKEHLILKESTENNRELA
jgi:hypothetical protein